MDTDFFSLDFSELFLKKHGKNIYDNICNKIVNEINGNCNSQYISIVFKIAFLYFFGLNQKGIQKLINDYYPKQNIDIQEILLKHNNSILEINKYLQDTMENEK
jgi:hypothetical protein